MHVLIVALLLVGPPAFAAEMREATPPPATQPSVVHQAADLVIARPVALVRLVGGIAMLPLALPVGLLLQDVGWALDVCVLEPFSDLVRSPLSRP
jgi:hypothetical protein